MQLLHSFAIWISLMLAKRFLQTVLIVGMTWSGGIMFGAEDKIAPDNPGDLNAKSKYKGAVAMVDLTWLDQSGNELGFEILRSDNAEEFRVVGMVGANTTRFTDEVGKYITGAFTYKVRAFNQFGKSSDSNVASVWF